MLGVVVGNAAPRSDNQEFKPRLIYWGQSFLILILVFRDAPICSRDDFKQRRFALNKQYVLKGHYTLKTARSIEFCIISYTFTGKKSFV